MIAASAFLTKYYSNSENILLPVLLTEVQSKSFPKYPLFHYKLDRAWIWGQQLFTSNSSKKQQHKRKNQEISIWRAPSFHWYACFPWPRGLHPVHPALAIFQNLETQLEMVILYSTSRIFQQEIILIDICSSWILLWEQNGQDPLSPQ